MLKEQILIDYVGVYTYVGKAIAGASHSAPVWTITRIEHDAVGKVVAVTHSEGCFEYHYAWADREALEYK